MREISWRAVRGRAVLRAFGLLLGLAAVMACAGVAETVTSPPPPSSSSELGTPDASPPPDPPDREGSDAPPAWVSTSAGAVWMQSGSYCTTDFCALAEINLALPEVQADLGEVLRFHVGVMPSVATIVLDSGDGQDSPGMTVSLGKGPVMEWVVEAHGDLRLRLETDDLDASYWITVEPAVERG